MCTISWARLPDGLHIFCNRDEQRTREAATPPFPGERDGITFIAPRDGRAGGSWIAVNEFGLAVCLLNHYPPAPPGPSAEPVSRGELVLSLMGCQDRGEAKRLLQDDTLVPYRPCIVLLFTLDQSPERFAWDGRKVSHTRLDEMVPQTSSAFQTQEVIASRLAQFATLPRRSDGPLPHDLIAYHRSHHPDRSAYSVCMHRPDAHTVSFTQLVVGPAKATVEYHAISPCKADKAVPDTFASLPLAHSQVLPQGSIELTP